MSHAQRVVAIVDDQETVRHSLERLLRAEGIRSTSFASGAKFLQSLDVLRPDCVILDLQMPQASGFDVLSRMAAADIDMPVVVLTGRDTAQRQQRTKKR